MPPPVLTCHLRLKNPLLVLTHGFLPLIVFASFSTSSPTNRWRQRARAVSERVEPGLVRIAPDAGRLVSQLSVPAHSAPLRPWPPTFPADVPHHRPDRELQLLDRGEQQKGSVESKPTALQATVPADVSFEGEIAQKRGICAGHRRAARLLRGSRRGEAGSRRGDSAEGGDGGGAAAMSAAHLPLAGEGLQSRGGRPHTKDGGTI